MMTPGVGTTDPRWMASCGKQPGEPAGQPHNRHQQTRAVDDGTRETRPACRDREAGGAQQDRDATECDDDHPLPLQPHTASAVCAGASLADQHDARGIERADKFHQ